MQDALNLKIKKFWQSSNFWVSIVLAIGALFVGFPAEEAKDWIYQLFGVLSGGMILRNFFKDNPLKFDLSKIKTANFWNYIAVIVTSIVGTQLPPELFTNLQQITEALMNADWQAAMLVAFQLVNIIYHLVKSKKAARSELAIS